MEDMPSIDILRRITGGDEDEDVAGRMQYLEKLFKEAGVPSALVDRDSDSPSLYVKLKSASPSFKAILLFGNVGDRPGDGMGAAVFIQAALWLRKQRIRLPFDLILLVTSGSDSGLSVNRLTERHPKLFADVQYAIGDFGSRPFITGNKKLYPITVAEKQSARLRITAHGSTGPVYAFNKRRFLKTTAAARIGKAAWRLGKPMRARTVGPVRVMAEAVGKALGEIDEVAVRFMLNPRLTGLTLALMRSGGRYFAPLMRNHANTTAIHTEDAPDGLPQSAHIIAEMRLLPGLPVSEGVADVRAVIGAGYEIEILECDGYPTTEEYKLFKSLAEPIVEKIPDARPVPFVSEDPTDARFLTRLGIQTYGYTPMYPPDIHPGKRSGDKAAAEAAALSAEALTRFLSRYGRGNGSVR